MSSPDAAPAAIADAVRAFFAEFEVASLRLPSGWFGRPHDNWHHLTDATSGAGQVRIRLDDTQVLALDAHRATRTGRILRIAIQGGSWHWVGYGAGDDHAEVLEAGLVELHAPYDRTTANAAD